MGILEQIAEQLSETNKNLLTKINLLNDKVSSLEYEITNGFYATQNRTAGLSLEFSTSDKLNVSFAAKILGITQGELVLLVKKGKINSIGKKKYIFLVSELIRYKNGDKQVKPKNINQRESPEDISIKKTVKKKINSIISENELQELFAKQAV